MWKTVAIAVVVVILVALALILSVKEEKIPVGYRIVEDDKAIDSSINPYMLGKDLVIEYKSSVKPRVEGLDYNILDDRVIIHNYNNEHFRLVFGYSSDVYEFGAITASTPFNVKWTLISDDLTHKEYLVEIQNLNSTEAKDFNLSIIISNTSFDLSKVSNLYLYEWKAINTSFPTYDTRLIEKNCSYIDNTTSENITYDCSYKETYQNGTVYKKKNTWKPSKMELITHPDKVSSDYSLINIPAFGSKEKLDDFGDVETVNGTKRFKISFDVPIGRTATGWGSYGQIVIIDKNTGKVYE